jgi:hypothetical protein
MRTLRNLLSAVALTLALTCLSVGVFAFTLAAAVLDPGRPTAALAAMLSSPAGQRLAVTAVADEIRRSDPTMTPTRAVALARAVVADPALPQALRQAGGVDGRGVMLRAVADRVALSSPATASRLRSIARRPAATAGPVAELVRTTGRLRSGARSVAAGAFSFAALGVALAVLVGPRRTRALRRAGRACLATALMPALLWLVLPRLVLPHLAGDWAVVLAAGLQAAGAPLAGLCTALIAAGAGCLLLAHLGRLAAPISGRRSSPPAVRAAVADRRARAATAGTGADLRL